MGGSYARRSEEWGREGGGLFMADIDIDWYIWGGWMHNKAKTA